MLLAGFKPRIPVFERSKAMRTVNRAATGTGSNETYEVIDKMTDILAGLTHIILFLSFPSTSMDYAISLFRPRIRPNSEYFQSRIL
jgi:hypothetical protein